MAFSMSNDTALPVVDFGPFLSGTRDDQVEVARQVDEAFRTHACLYLTNHGIPQADIDEAFHQVNSSFLLNFNVLGLRP